MQRAPSYSGPVTTPVHKRNLREWWGAKKTSIIKEEDRQVVDALIQLKNNQKELLRLRVENNE